MNIPGGFTTTIQKRSANSVKITIPGLSINMAKAMQYARQHPVNEELAEYSSRHPEILNAIDLKMMSTLDKLRYVNNLKDRNSDLRDKLDAAEGRINLAQKQAKAEEQKLQMEKAIEERAQLKLKNKSND